MKSAKQQSNNLKSRQGLRLSLSATILALSIGGLAMSAGGAPGSHTASNYQQNGDRGQATPADIEVERITIKPGGFEPSEIRRPAGPFLLAIVNQTRLADLSVEVYRMNGQKLHELRAKKGQLRQHTIVDVPPGRYVLKEANHPEWICRIFIT